MGKFEFTPMMTRYLIKFAFRISIFLGIFGLYLFSDVSLWDLANQPIMHGITCMHVLWVTFMVIMISHIFPGTFRTMALKKADKEVYREKDGYSELEMYRFVQDQNRKAWIVMLVWLIGNGVIGFFYLKKATHTHRFFVRLVGCDSFVKFAFGFSAVAILSARKRR